MRTLLNEMQISTRYGFTHISTAFLLFLPPLSLLSYLIFNMHIQMKIVTCIHGIFSALTSKRANDINFISKELQFFLTL